jgi:TPR repeat protein
MQKIYQRILFLAIPIALCSTTLSFTVVADTDLGERNSIKCTLLGKFYAYKDGMLALREKDMLLAFDIFCSLALQGDDRAQFKLAEIVSHKYSSSITKDLSVAYAWSKLANARLHSVRKANLTKAIFSSLSEDEKLAAQGVFEVLRTTVPTGIRIDQAREDIDLAKIYSEYHDKLKNRTFTGSRLKRENPAGFLKQLSVN